MANLLILGGSGFLGSVLCEKLVERFGAANARIVVPSRHPTRARHLLVLPTLEVPDADVHDDRELAALVRGADAVVNLVATLHGDESTLDRVNVQLPRRLAVACDSANVRRLVHVSALGADARAPSRYLRSKAGGEAALTSKTLDLTILRPSVMFGRGDRFLNLFARLQGLFPAVPLAGADARFQPVWVDDVADAVVRCLDDRSTFGETIECCGPEVYTLRQLVEIAGRLSGHPRPVIALPDALGRLQALTFEWLPGEPLMTRDNLRSMEVPNVASGERPGLARLGIQPAALEAIAAQYLGQDGPRQRIIGRRAAVHHH
jgi:NADH dehydrogenase